MEKKLKLHRKFDVKEKKTDDAEPMKCPKQMVTMTIKEGSTCGANQLEHCNIGYWSGDESMKQFCNEFHTV